MMDRENRAITEVMVRRECGKFVGNAYVRCSADCERCHGTGHYEDWADIYELMDALKSHIKEIANDQIDRDKR